MVCQVTHNVINQKQIIYISGRWQPIDTIIALIQVTQVDDYLLGLAVSTSNSGGNNMAGFSAIPIYNCCLNFLAEELIRYI